MASFPAVLPGQVDHTPDASRPAAPVVPRPEPPGTASTLLPASPAPSIRGEQGPSLATLGASEAASPPAPRRHRAARPPGRGRAETQARWCYRRQPSPIPGYGSKLMGTSAIPLGKSVQWEASERFRLTIGNVRGMRLALNGRRSPCRSGRSNVQRDLLLTRALLHEGRVHQER